MNRIRGILTALILSAYGCSGPSPTDTDPPPPPEPRLEIISPTVNRTIQSGPLTPVEFCATVQGTGLPVHWSIDGGPATQAGNCTTEPLAPGEYNACVSSGNLTECTGHTVVEQGQMVNIPFQVIVVGSGVEPVATRLCVVNMEPEVCSPASAVDGRGTLSQEIPWAIDTLVVLAEGDGLIPAILYDVPANTPDSFIFKVTSRERRIASGTYAGMVEEISMEKGCEPSRDQYGNSFQFCGWWDGGTWVAEYRPYRVDRSKTIPFVLDRSLEEIYSWTPSDSLTILEGIETFNRYHGGEFFRMGSVDEGLPECETVIVTINTVPNEITRAAPRFCPGKFPLITGGSYHITLDGLRRNVIAPWMTVHELGHMWGFFHTCASVSVMAFCPPEYLESSLVPTTFDVAYMQFVHEFGESEVTYPSPGLNGTRITGFGELHNGERYLLGKEPIDVWYDETSTQ